jgi:hypothetical protein
VSAAQIDALLAEQAEARARGDKARSRELDVALQALGVNEGQPPPSYYAEKAAPPEAEDDAPEAVAVDEAADLAPTPVETADAPAPPETADAPRPEA